MYPSPASPPLSRVGFEWERLVATEPTSSDRSQGIGRARRQLQEQGMDLSEELKLAAVKAMQVEGLGKWHIPSQERLSRLEVGVGELGEDG